MLALSFGRCLCPVCDVRATVCVVCRRGRTGFAVVRPPFPLQFLLRVLPSVSESKDACVS